jgi:hypothetical protein
MRRKTEVILIMMCVLGSSMVMSQPYPGGPFTRGYNWEVGAKALSLGGAFTGVSDDYSALFYNPAGLGQITRASMVGGFSHLMLEDQATSYGFTAIDEASFSKLGQLGLVLPVPTFQGSIVLAFGYHRIRGFGRALSLPEVVHTVDYDVVTESDLYSVPFDVINSGQVLQEGSLSQTSLGASIEVAPNVYLGGSLNFWGGIRDYSWDRYVLGDVYNVQIDTSSYDVLVADTYYSTHYRESYSGLNMTLGAFLKPVSFFQLGIVVKTPVVLRGKRDTDLYIYEEVPPGWDRFDDYSDNWPASSKIQSPWVFQAGGSFTIGPMMITGEADLTDYSQIRYKTDTSEGITQSSANNQIRKNLRSTVNYRFGGELAVPFLPLFLRGGYGIQKSPQKDALSTQDRKTLSLGFGVNLSQQFVLDVGYAVTSWKYGPDYLIDEWGYAWTSWEDTQVDPIGLEDIQIQKIKATLTYEM